MYSNSTNEDVRSVKTKKALYTSMFALLKKSSFRKLTIKAICEEALISRAAFYAHFIDKYDLLKHCLTEFWPISFKDDATYEQIEALVNYHTSKNIPILKNIICDADNETFIILYEFILSNINPIAEQENNEELYIKNVVLSNFYAGGIISYILWHIKNEFPPNVPPMNRYMYEIILDLQDWHTK